MPSTHRLPKILSALWLLGSQLVTTSDAARGRPTLNGKTFVADNGEPLRGPFTSTEWAAAAPESTIAEIKNLGFNALHLYAETYNPSGTGWGSRVSYVDSIVQSTADLGLYLVMVIGNGANNGDYNLAYAEGFWNYYGARYAADTHVIYEIFNEPVSWGPPYSSSTANPPGAINLQVQAYNIIRKVAPSTPILFFSYSVLSGSDSAILTDIQALNTQIHGNANAKWTNEAVGFHGYGGDTNTYNTIKALLSAGYPAFLTEFGTVNNAIDTAMVKNMESLGVSWLDFQGIDSADVSDEVLPAANYQNAITAAGICWTPDYGTFPECAGTHPTTTTTHTTTTTTTTHTTTTTTTTKPTTTTTTTTAQGGVGTVTVTTIATVFVCNPTTTATTTTSSGGTTGCASIYSQCGGFGWTGATCCAAGSTCQFGNTYYSQCLP